MIEKQMTTRDCYVKFPLPNMEVHLLHNVVDGNIE